MPVLKMHAGEVEIDEPLVHRLLKAQFPQWANLTLEAVPSTGTDNALFRLGRALLVRLPRIHWAVNQVEKESYWLPRLAPLLPVAIPALLEIGNPGEGYPYSWGIYRWLDGENPKRGNLSNPYILAEDLAQFILALQNIDTAGGPLAIENNLRGIPLALRDVQTRTAIQQMEGLVDTELVTAAWEASLRAPGWDRLPVWFHGDLLPGNLLLNEGHLNAVIDFSCLGVGDPACDLMSAWSLFEGQSREAFRCALGVDNATWQRGRGQALSQAVIFIPYYLETNPVGVRNARQALEAVLADFQKNG